MAKLIHPDVHFVFPVNKGPKSSDDKPTSESYVKYWRELALADPYFSEADLQKAIGIESKVGLIAVAEAKAIISKLSLASVSDGYKAVIFYLPEKMNQETANRLLKLVEEPPEKTLFLFITHAPEKVLQTIFSRCQSIRVMPLTKEEQARVEALRPSADREEYDAQMDLFSDLMNALVSRDLMGTLECAETMAALDSREKQKAFCTFVADCIRKIFMIQQNLHQLAGVSPEEEDFYTGISGKIARTFCTRTITNIEKAVAMIDRNVNSKIVFCDLVNRMFLSV
jgi:DNA polymerase-3 subunit delta'